MDITKNMTTHNLLSYIEKKSNLSAKEFMEDFNDFLDENEQDENNNQEDILDSLDSINDKLEIITDILKDHLNCKCKS